MAKPNVFSCSVESLKHLKSEQGELQSKPFVDVCRQILPILDKFGAAMSVVKSDIGGNISIGLMISLMQSLLISKLERLESTYSSNPSRFNYLYSLVLAEVETNSAKSSSSCTNGLLWLTRAMDFLVMLFVNLSKHQDWSMHQACADSYSKTLKKWHGWLASSSFTVAMKLVPDRKKFMEVIGGEANIQTDMQKFCTEFAPTLAEIHKFLAKCGLDSMKAS